MIIRVKLETNEVWADYAGDNIFVAVDLKSESYDYASDVVWGTLTAVKENKLLISRRSKLEITPT